MFLLFSFIFFTRISTVLSSQQRVDASQQRVLHERRQDQSYRQHNWQTAAFLHSMMGQAGWGVHEQKVQIPTPPTVDPTPVLMPAGDISSPTVDPTQALLLPAGNLPASTEYVIDRAARSRMNASERRAKAKKLRKVGEGVSDVTIAAED